MKVKDTVLTHFGFSRMPFGKDVPIDRVFPGSSLAETTAMLSLGLDCEDIMLITGAIGCGKSLLVRRAACDFDPDRYQLIYLRGGLSGASELYKLVLRGLSVEPPRLHGRAAREACDQPHSLMKAKSRYFASVIDASRKPIVVLDDAQDAHPEAPAALKAMTNFESDSQSRIAFILVGQPELASLLSLSHFESVRERIRIACRKAYRLTTGTSGRRDSEISGGREGKGTLAGNTMTVETRERAAFLRMRQRMLAELEHLLLRQKISSNSRKAP